MQRNTMELAIPMDIGVIRYYRGYRYKEEGILSVFIKGETRQCGTAERQGLLRMPLFI